MDLKELQTHIRALAMLPEAGTPVVSCYLDLSGSQPGYRHSLDERIRLLRTSLSGETLRSFEEALSQIEGHLRESVPAGVKGSAIFARGGPQTFFLPLHFRVPLPNWVAVDTTPNIYHLVELKDTYHRYVALIATERSVRILGVNLGAVTQEVWKQFPEFGERVGREWTKQHYQDHRRERNHRFTSELIRTLDQLMSGGGYGHLILAGQPRMTTQIKEALPKHLAAKLVDIVATARYERTKDVVAATLAAFIGQEEQQSRGVVDTLLRQLNTQGLAVAGPLASFEALRRGQVDVLVLSQGYGPDFAWTCDACGATDTKQPAPRACSECAAGTIREFNIKEELVRMAEQMESGVEVVNHSDALTRLGGVGCLLRFHGPERLITQAA